MIMSEISTNSISKSGELTRRDFLRASSLAAGAAVMGFPAIVNAQAKMPMNAVILGLGGRGAGAGQNFLEAAKIVGVDAKIVAVSDVFAGQARRGREAFGLPEEKCYGGV
jgi:hypothetical protein